MSQQRDSSRGRLRSIASDLQFWIPVVVLIGGLLVLRWLA
jgi:hypothetical protein